MKKRLVEVFVAGCPACAEAAEQVKALACPCCDLKILDMRSNRRAQAKAKKYGVKKVPAVVVDGRLADCCSGGIDPDALRRLGVGMPV